MEELKNINSLKDIVNVYFSNYKDKEAFIQKNTETQEYEHITYSNLKTEINGLGTYMLKKLKINGEKVAIIGENSYEWFVTYMAVVCGVGVAVSIDRSLSAEEIVTLIDRAQIKVIVYSFSMKNIIEKVKLKIKGCKFIQIDKREEDNYSLNWKIIVDEGIELVNKGEQEYINKEIDIDKMAVLLFTSGIYGNNKGVMLSHRNICSSIYSYSCNIPDFSSYTGLSVTPMHYAYEFILNYLFMTAIGGRLGIVHNEDNIIEKIQVIKPDYILTAPYMVKKISERIENIVKENRSNMSNTIISIIKGLGRIGINTKNSSYTKIHDFFGGNLKYIVCCAPYLTSNSLKIIQKYGISIIQCYTLAECAPLIASTGIKEDTGRSVGKAVENVEVRVDLSKNENENSNIGEIIVSGKNIMIGYYNDEELTKKTLKKGWLYTGDLGYFNLSGELILVGKKNNLIIDQNNKKIYPEEIERYLNNLTFIRDSLVYNKYYLKSNKDIRLVARVEIDEEDLRTVYNNEIPSDETLFKVISEEIKKINRMIPSYKAIKELEIKKTPFKRNVMKQILREGELKTTSYDDIITKEKILKSKDDKKQK